MSSYALINARIVNEGKIFTGFLITTGKRISRIGEGRYTPEPDESEHVIIDLQGSYLMPGVIDDQVHFRDPGLTHKADIRSESRAALAGGITSYMEMPNTIPQTLSQKLLQDKYDNAAQNSYANYSFYMGASNDNLDELLKTDPCKVCGIKVFMGSSTGNMLVDNPESLRNIFSQVKLPIAVHCEDEPLIQENTRLARDKYGVEPPVNVHPMIRSSEACYKSSSLAVSLAKEYGTRLHLLHLSTAAEMSLLDDSPSDENKKITAEVCVHHLWFNDYYYDSLGTHIKWNPAIKTENDRSALIKSLMNNKIDVVATDHAPHTLEEKNNSYFKAPSGGPMVQHSLPLMLEFCRMGVMDIPMLAEKMCHAPARIFNIKERGFLKEGFMADLCVFRTDKKQIVDKDSLLYKCKWSPLEGLSLHSLISHTFVNGELAFHDGKFSEKSHAMRLEFDR